MRRGFLLFAVAIALGCRSPLAAGGTGGSPGGGGTAGTASGGSPGVGIGGNPNTGIGGSGGNPSSGSGGLASGASAGVSSVVGTGGISAGGSGGYSDGALTLDKSIVNLGTLDLGGTGVATVTLTNTNRASTGVLVVTPSAGVIATGCSGSLPGGASCTITITVTPTLAGTFTGTVSITANPGTVTPLLVSVIATVPGPGDRFSVSPPLIDLGDIMVGVAAQKQTITIATSARISDLTISASGADVSIDKPASTCTTTLAAGASCVVVVNFLATTAGSKSDAIVISAGGAGGMTVSVPITAIAQRPAKLAISPSTAQTFVASSSTTSSAITFGVANTGDVPTGVISTGVTGPNAADFIISTNCLVLAPLAGCTISVVFKPTPVDAGAARTATLVVTDSGSGAASVSVPLAEYRSGPPALTIYPSTTDLGSAVVGTLGPSTSFTLVNSGVAATGALKLSVSSSEFVISNDTCSGAIIIPNGSCTLAVALKPVTAGAKSATLTVANDGGNPAVRTLTGVGVTSAKLEADRATLAFGSVPVNQVSPVVGITIKNSGGSNTGPLSFTTTGRSAVFPIGSYTCSTPLSPGSSCTLEVSFVPTVAQSESATIAVTDGSTSVTLSLTGTGTP